MPLEYMHLLACSCPVGMVPQALAANPVTKTGAGHLCSREAQILKAINLYLLEVPKGTYQNRSVPSSSAAL